jgi:hypothetical protein
VLDAGHASRPRGANRDRRPNSCPSADDPTAETRNLTSPLGCPHPILGDCPNFYALGSIDHPRRPVPVESRKTRDIMVTATEGDHGTRSTYLAPGQRAAPGTRTPQRTVSMRPRENRPRALPLRHGVLTVRLSSVQTRPCPEEAASARQRPRAGPRGVRRRSRIAAAASSGGVGRPVGPVGPVDTAQCVRAVPSGSPISPPGFNSAPARERAWRRARGGRRRRVACATTPSSPVPRWRCASEPPDRAGR